VATSLKGMPMQPAAEESARRTRILLWTLMLIYILNFLDRQIVNILAEPISRDLGLSDTQIGLMTGLAFAVFYTVLGIPIARYADHPRSNRVWLIAGSLAIWSAMTAACGMAQNFTQMLLARIGVGVGEAGCAPASHSLITDSVDPGRRATAIAFFGLGIPIGGFLGSFLGGGISDAYGWRTAFLVAAVPGILLACIVPLLIRDPRTGLSATMAARAAQNHDRLSFREALGDVLGSRAFVLLLIAASLTAFLSYGKSVWVTILYIRSFGLSPGEVGLWLGLITGSASLLGTWIGGWAADKFGAVNKRHILTAPAIGMLLAAPLLFLSYWSTDWKVAAAMLFLPTLLNYMYYGPCYSVAHSLVRPQARAVATSIMMFGQNLIGLGLGPLFFGFLSDWFKPVAGPDSVRWVLYGAAWLGLIPAFFYWRASLRLKDDLRSE
jgi:predicted MFS family arabinose efflux permease